jgi:hypothetical protein
MSELTDVRASTTIDAPVHTPDQRSVTSLLGNRRLQVVAVVTVLVLGATLRYRFGLASSAPFDGDESVVGVLARSIRHGRPAAFYPGQPYGGSIGAFVVAGAQVVFGQTLFALRIGAFLESFVIIYLIGQIAKRSGGNTMLAVSIASLWPLSLVALSVREYCFYNVGVMLGCAVWLLAIAEVETPRRRLIWYSALGFGCGLSLWTTFQAGMIVVPCLVVVVIRLRRELQRNAAVIVFLVGAIVGALPWLVRNVNTSFASIKSNSLLAHPVPYWQRVLISARGLIFQPFGDAGQKVADKLPTSAVVLALGSLFVVLIVIAARNGVNRIALAIVVAYPIVGGLNPLSGLPVAQFRYVYYAWPALVVLLAHVIPRNRRLAAVFLLLLTSGVAVSWHDQTRLTAVSLSSATALADSLRGSHADVILASYWDAYTVEYICGNDCPRTVSFSFVRNTPDEPDAPFAASYVLAGVHVTLAKVSAVLEADRIGFDVQTLDAPGYFLLHLHQPIARFSLGRALGV